MGSKKKSAKKKSGVKKQATPPVNNNMQPVQHEVEVKDDHVEVKEEVVEPVTKDIQTEVVEKVAQTVEQPTEPVVEQPTEPVVEQPSEPVVEQPSEPVVEQPSEPVVEQPSQVEPKEPAEKVFVERSEPAVEQPEATKAVDTPQEITLEEGAVAQTVSTDSKWDGFYITLVLYLTLAMGAVLQVAALTWRYVVVPLDNKLMSGKVQAFAKRLETVSGDVINEFEAEEPRPVRKALNMSTTALKSIDEQFEVVAFGGEVAAKVDKRVGASEKFQEVFSKAIKLDETYLGGRGQVYARKALDVATGLLQRLQKA